MLLLRTCNGDVNHFLAYIKGDNFNKYKNAIRGLASREWDRGINAWKIALHDFDILISDCKKFQLNEIDVSFELKQLMDQFRVYVQSYIDITNKTETDYPIENGILKGDPMGHQKVANEFFIKRVFALNGSQMGTGKTFPALITARSLLEKSEIKNCLIVCPSTVKYNWVKEIEKFLEYCSYSVIEGSERKREPLYYDDSFFKIVNFELIRQDYKNVCYDAVFDCIIVDEAHRLKTQSSLQSKAIRHFGKKAKYRFGITGTPIHNRLQDLFAILEFIKPGYLGNYHHFKMRHAVIGYWGQIEGYRNLPEVHEKLKSIMIRKKKEDVLKDLPPKIYKDIRLTMKKKQLDLYKKIKNETILDVDGNPQQGQVLTKMIRLREVCDTCELIDPENKESVKLTELKELLTNLVEDGNKVVVFSQWLRMIKIISKNIKQPHAILSGEIQVSGGFREEIIQRFRESETTNILLMTTAGGEGINLQCANYIIFVDLPFNPQMILQIEDRLHRKGQINKVTIIRLIIKDAIEDRVLEILKEKMELATRIVDGEYSLKMQITNNELRKALNDWEEK